jgi:hypothetical protein
MPHLQQQQQWVLSSLPAISACTFSSGVITAVQGACWQAGAEPPATPTARSDSSSSDAVAKRPTVHLTIDSAEQLPAADAVIAAMYGMQDAISSLEQHQVVHAVVIADMVHAETAGQQALQVLQAAAESEQGLSATAVQALTGLSVWPACLLQLLPTIVKHAPCCKVDATDWEAVTAADDGGRVQWLLVAALGDLQAVWSDKQLKELLLGLPLPAMQLLLSSDQLRVPSEDTVLYTADVYMSAKCDDAGQAAKAALAQLVRAPQLSLLALRCAALPADSDQQLLGAYAQELRDLLALRQLATAEELPSALQQLGGTPASWQLGPRQIRPLEGDVRLEWRLPVEQLRQACRDSFEQKTVIAIESPWAGWAGSCLCHVYRKRAGP